VIQTFANQNNWIFIGGIAEGFAGKGYCAGEDRMYVQAEESLLNQGDTEGIMHPNAEGHIWIGEQVAKHLDKHLINAIKKPVKPPIGGGSVIIEK
jgi:hypothetical protein